MCRREGIAEGLYYSWSKEFLEAGKKRLPATPGAKRPRAIGDHLVVALKLKEMGAVPYRNQGSEVPHGVHSQGQAAVDRSPFAGPRGDSRRGDVTVAPGTQLLARIRPTTTADRARRRTRWQRGHPGPIPATSSGSSRQHVTRAFGCSVHKPRRLGQGVHNAGGKVKMREHPQTQRRQRLLENYYHPRLGTLRARSSRRLGPVIAKRRGPWKHAQQSHLF